MKQEMVILDTNILIDLLSEEKNVLDEFLRYIEGKTFIPMTVREEFFQEIKIYNKGYEKAKKIYDCNLLLEGKENEFKNNYLKKIFDNLMDIRKKYNIESKELNEFLMKKEELLNQKNNNQLFLNKILYRQRFDKFIYDTTIIINKLLEYYNLPKADNLLQDINIVLIEFRDSNGSLAQKINYYSDKDKLYENYSRIKKFIEVNLRNEYTLSKEEKKKIISFCDNTDKNWWGKKDKKKPEDRYNDQFIWNEIIKLSLHVDSQLIFLTNDHKDFQDSTLKIEMIDQITNATHNKMSIIKLQECSKLQEMRKKQELKYKVQVQLIKEFRDLKCVEDVLDDTINFIEENSDEISEYLATNKESVEELFFDEDYVEGEEYLLAIDLISSYQGCYDYNDVDIKCEILDVFNEEVLYNIIIIFYVLEQSEFEVTYKASYNRKFEPYIERIEFQISGNTYKVNYTNDEEEFIRKFQKLIGDELQFKNYIDPIF